MHVRDAPKRPLNRSGAGSTGAAAARRFARPGAADRRTPAGLEIEPAALASPSLFAGAPDAVWLEMGFGAGEHLVAQAKAHPEVGFVGCEPFLNGVVAALAAIERDTSPTSACGGATRRG